MGSTISVSPPKPGNHIETTVSRNNQMSTYMAAPSLPPVSSIVDSTIDTSFGLVDQSEILDQKSANFASKNIFTKDQPPHDFFSQRSPLDTMMPSPSTCFQRFLMDPKKQPPSTCFSIPKEQLPSVHFRANLPLNPENQQCQSYYSCHNIQSNNEDHPSNPSHYPPMNTREKYQFSYEFLPPSYINSLEVPHRPFNLNSNFANAMGDLLNHDQEAVKSFLAGTVRPGPDVTQIYKCNECSLEFPNAQAYGGHMSSHSKIKNATMLEGGKNNQSKHTCIAASSSRSSKRKSRKRARFAMEEKQKKKSNVGKRPLENEGIQKKKRTEVQEKKKLEGIESKSSEPITGDETDFKN